MTSAQKYPHTGQRVPDFSLQSSAGQRIATSDYRARRNLVLALVGKPAGDAAHALLTELAAHYAEFVAEEAEVLAVVWGPVAEADKAKHRDTLPFPVLADEDGAVHRAFGALNSNGGFAAAVYITDRFGEIFAAYRTGAGEPLPTVEEMLDWLRFIGLQCPE